MRYIHKYKCIVHTYRQTAAAIAMHTYEYMYLKKDAHI